MLDMKLHVFACIANMKVYRFLLIACIVNMKMYHFTLLACIANMKVTKSF